MGWSRRPNPAEDEAAGQDDPLADNMRFERSREADSDAPADDSGGASIYEQQTVVDQNFASRAQARRHRQAAGGMSTQRITTWAADPGNSRKLFVAGGVVLALVLLLALWRISSNWTASGTQVEDLGLPSEGAAASIEAPSFEEGVGASAAASSVGTGAQPAENVPGTDPAAQSAAPPTATAFVVTGTGTEGLFLRSEPNQNNTPVATIPEGTRVEATGNTQNDGTREWREIRTELGTGWVAAEFLQPAP